MSISLSSDSPRAATRSTAEWWSREVELVDRLRSIREQTAAVLGDDSALPQIDWDAAWRHAELISALTHACIERLRSTKSGDARTAQRLCDLVLNAQQLAMDWYLFDTSMRGERLADCAAGLNRLRRLPSSSALLANACAELVQRCGFHRAVLSRVQDRSWTPLILHDREQTAQNSWFSDWINQAVPLVNNAPETELLSRRRPSLVSDTANAPVYRPLIVQAGHSRSYVVAPLIQSGQVVGFLHTDHHPLQRRADLADRDVLWAFTDGFNHIYERTLLVERLREHRDSVRELFFGAVDDIDALCESIAEAARLADSAESGADPEGVELTEREAEVFELMVTGASNQDIADKLVISEGTVKSHVKHILRKYGAVNRAQAIAWALKDR